LRSLAQDFWRSGERRRLADFRSLLASTGSRTLTNAAISGDQIVFATPLWRDGWGWALFKSDAPN
jgi:hypothetical protein